MEAETNTKNAKRVVTLDEVVFKETTDKTKAILACIPLVAIILFLFEKEDLFTRYMAAQFTIVSLVPLAFVVTIIFIWLVPFLQVVLVALAIFAIIQVNDGKRFDVPMVSKWALSLMNKF
ncbi:MAG: hypothetical protein Fur003_5260 [Candidatus Dojkabacteria bacterium]